MSTIIKPGANGMRRIHPGEILREEFLRPLKITSSDLATALRVKRTLIDEVIDERRAVAADLGLRLARYMGVSAKFWLNLQQAYDIKTAENALRSQLDQIEPLQRDE